MKTKYNRVLSTGLCCLAFAFASSLQDASYVSSYASDADVTTSNSSTEEATTLIDLYRAQIAQGEFDKGRNLADLLVKNPQFKDVDEDERAQLCFETLILHVLSAENSDAEELEKAKRNMKEPLEIIIQMNQQQELPAVGKLLDLLAEDDADLETVLLGLLKLGTKSSNVVTKGCANWALGTFGLVNLDEDDPNELKSIVELYETAKTCGNKSAQYILNALHKGDKATRTQVIVDFLKEKGYRPELDKDGDVRFMYEGKLYLVIADKDDSDYYCVVRLAIDDDEGNADAKNKAAIKVSATIKAIKLYPISDCMSVTAEAYYSTPEEFTQHLLQLLRCCQGAEEMYDKELN